MKKTHVAIIGSHGYRANYGGWDQLVNNLVDIGSNSKYKFFVYNSKNTVYISPPSDCRLIYFGLHAHGFQGLLFDFLSVFHSIFVCDKLIFLGAQAFPVALLIKFIFRLKVELIVNPGGIEWTRPKFGPLAKLYLKFVFNLSSKFADKFVLDNEHYKSFINQRKGASNVEVIPYGGEIDNSLDINFAKSSLGIVYSQYYLSVSRALEDNCLYELCDVFSSTKNKNLVLISNFNSSSYGRFVFKKFTGFDNIYLIDSLYDKAKLDAVRRGCKAYIHTHTLCGSAPSLIEMIVCGRPILSIDVPQNRFTLSNEGYYFKSFSDLSNLIDLDSYVCTSDFLRQQYNWDLIVQKYLSANINN